MGVNLTIARLKVSNDKILGTVKSLGLCEVDLNDCSERIESIEIRDGLPLFDKIIRGQIIQDDGILYLEPIEKLFLGSLICFSSGRGILNTDKSKSLIPLIKAEYAFKAIDKLIPFDNWFKSEGLLDKDSNMLLNLHKLLKIAVENNNLIYSAIG